MSSRKQETSHEVIMRLSWKLGLFQPVLNITKFPCQNLLLFIHSVVYSFSCVQLFCNPMDCSLSGSSVHGILQARILKWVAIPFCRGSSRPREDISFIGGWVLYYWTTWEAQNIVQVMLKIVTRKRASIVSDDSSTSRHKSPAFD